MVRVTHPPPSLSRESVLISYTLPVVSTSFSALGSAPGLLLCHGEELLGYLYLYIKTLPDSSGCGRGQQRYGPGGTEPLSWPRVTSQPALRAAEAAGGSQSQSSGQMGKGGNHPHPPVDQSVADVWEDRGYLPSSQAEGPTAHVPAAASLPEPLGASFCTEGGSRWPQTLGIQDPFG